MKMITLCLLWIATSFAADAATKTYRVDSEKSKIEFRVRNFAITSVEGKFKSFQGTVDVPPDSDSFTVNGTIDVDSIDTDNESRDKHLRTEDFFDVANHPKINFKGTGKVEGEKATLQGDLTIRGKTSPVTLEGTTERKDNELKLDLKGEIDRTIFGVNYGSLIANTVKLKLDLVALTK